MSEETLEILAELQGEDLQEIRRKRTKKPPEDLRDDIYSYLENLIGNSFEKFDSTYERGRQSNISEKTYKQRELSILQLLEWYEENERTYLNKSIIQSYFSYLSDEGYADTTIETRYWQIMSFLSEECNSTIEREARKITISKIQSNNKTTDKEGQGARPIRMTEKEQLIQTLNKKYGRNPLSDENEKRDLDYHRLLITVRIAWQTGLRATEIANLTTEQIDLEKRKIEDVQTAKRDDNHTRTLSFNLRLKEDLRKWMQVYRKKYKTADDSLYLIPTHKSEQIYPRNLTKSIRKLADEAGIQDYNQTHSNGARRAEITIHSFRKGFALQRLREGGNLQQVRELLGHKQISTTQNYLPLSEEDLDYSPQSSESLQDKL